MEYKRLTDSETAKSMKKHGNLINPYYVRLAELEDKIEHGMLVDTEERFIIEDELWGSKNRFLICKHHIETLIEDFCPTREEAEKRLKEVQNG